MKSNSGERMLLQGNEAIAEGALYAGCNFFAGYPITPASEIGEVLSLRLPGSDGAFIQMEDEIAGIGAALGASLAGAKSMTATSGPGFSLMQENIGFGCMAEIPCVIVNVMRGGLSTGLPTNPSQGDVMQARWGTHGDHPIIVLCVSDALECFEVTITAFNLSEKYRTPVILLSDEIVAHTREIVTMPLKEDIKIFNRIPPDRPPEWFIPFEDNRTGVPPMPAFGGGYRYHVTGLTHDKYGFPTDQPLEVGQFMNRIFRKITLGFNEIQITKRFMLDDAEIAVIAYGSVSRSARRAVLEARAEGIKAGLMQLVTLFPFPRKDVTVVMNQCRVVLVPEMNMGQIKREVERVNTKAKIKKYNRVDGQFITPGEILEELRKL